MVITVLLLALLTLALYALGALSRVGTGIATTAAQQTQARQNALLGLQLALGELQRVAGADNIVTGMAGLGGIPPGAGQPARHWCGVWTSDGQFLRWLASGAAGPAIPPLSGGDSVALLAAGALGADGADKEHVRVLIEPVVVTNGQGASFRLGGYAWWVGDEGVKLSAVVPVTEAPVLGGKHALDELIPVLSPDAVNLERVEAYAQLAFVPSPALTPGVLQSNLHVLTRAHQGMVGENPQAGRLNINSSSARFWRGVAATYNRQNPTKPLGITPTLFGNRIRDNFSATVAPGKAAGGPFVNIDSFFEGQLLETALQGSGVAATEFRGVMSAWLTTRSDTFRIRAYGEARNTTQPGVVEATAWCEAIVQRQAELLPIFGRRFGISYFRWLGPEDI